MKYTVCVGLYTQTSKKKICTAICAEHRSPQNYVTDDTPKIWTDGKIPYVFFDNLSESSYLIVHDI